MGDARFLIEGDLETYSVQRLWNEVNFAFEKRFGAGVWLRAIVKSIRVDQRGHNYLELSDPTSVDLDAAPAMVSAVIWSTMASRISASLRERDLAPIEQGHEVRVFGSLDAYAPRGSVRFKISKIDLDELKRAKLLEVELLREKLRSEGIWERNRNLVVPDVPLSIALVTSMAGSVRRDFVRPLIESGFAFKVKLFSTSVTGESSAAPLISALWAAESSECDLVVLIRGGGSVGELSVFNREDVVRAVLGCSKPVFAGIGHSTDSVLVDEASNKSFDVPQSVAKYLVEVVQGYQTGLVESYSRLGVRVAQILANETSLFPGKLRLIASYVARQIDEEMFQISRKMSKLGELCGNSIRDEHDSLVKALSTLAMEAKSKIQGVFSALHPQLSRLKYSQEILWVEQARVLELSNRLDWFDAESVIRRGYVIISSDDGVWLRKKVDLTKAGRGFVKFSDGTVGIEVLNGSGTEEA